MDISDPYTQSFTLIGADGTTFNATLYEIDDYLQYSIKICINYGSQIGASIVLFIVLLLLTRLDKRHSPVFFPNSCALFFNICRLICMVTYFTTKIFRAYPLLSGDLSEVPLSAYVNSILGVILTFFLVVCFDPADTSRLYDSPQCLQTHHLRDVNPHSSCSNRIPSGVCSRKLKNHGVRGLYSICLAAKCHKHPHNHQHLLLQRDLRNQAGLHHLAAQAARTEAVWSNAGNLHYGLSDYDRSW